MAQDTYTPTHLKFTHMKKKIYLYIALLFSTPFLVVCGWLIWHYQGLTPKFLFQLPVEECDMLKINRTNSFWNGTVNVLCQSQGFPYNPGPNYEYFAIKGEKIKCFIPDRFHSVKIDIEVMPADENFVYFYRYRSRYRYYIY